MTHLTRRRFLQQLGLASLPLIAHSGVQRPATKNKANIQWAYSAITWGGNDVQAISDISSLGFSGIQLRSNAFPVYGQKPEELKHLLDQAKLKLAMFSSGSADINTGNDEAQIATHVAHAKFVKALGGKYIQVTNSSRPKTGTPSQEDLVKYGKLLTAVGKRTAQEGITVAYHNHMGQLGQTPEEVKVILDNADPRYVSFLLDIANYQQGGGDPAAAIHTYKDRLKALHIKDVRDKQTEGSTGGYVFVELGRGRVNLPAVLEAINAVGFTGYAVIELDAVPEKEKKPLECARISSAYLKDALHVDVRS